MEKVDIEAYAEAVEELYPADTITGGVRAAMVAEEVGRSRRQASAQLRKLADEGRLKRLGGLRGPTYAPETADRES